MKIKLKQIALDTNLMRPDELPKAIEAYHDMQNNLEELKKLNNPSITNKEFLDILGEFYTWDLNVAKDFAQNMAGENSLAQDFVLSAPAFSGKLFCETKVPKQIFTWDDFREFMKSNNVVLWDLDNYGTPEISLPKIEITPAQFTDVFHLLVGQMVPNKFSDLNLYGYEAVEKLKQVFTPEKIRQDIILYVHMLRAVGKSINLLVGANLDMLITKAESVVYDAKGIDQSLNALEDSLMRL